MRKLTFTFLTVMVLLSLSGCGKQAAMKDGYYTAQQKNYVMGWKEFVTITIKQDKIIAVEYNAANESGFIKSWDNGYMKIMKPAVGTYPNEYTRNYAAQLLNGQSPEDIDAVSGASTSWGSFKILAAAAMEQAEKGDSSVAAVDTEPKP